MALAEADEFRAIHLGVKLHRARDTKNAAEDVVQETVRPAVELGLASDALPFPAQYDLSGIKEIFCPNGSDEDKIVVEEKKRFGKRIDPPKHCFNGVGVKRRQRPLIPAEYLRVVDDTHTKLFLFFRCQEGGHLIVGDEVDVADPRGELADGVEAPSDFAVVGESGGVLAGRDEAAASVGGSAQGLEGGLPLGAVSGVVAIHPCDNGVDGAGGGGLGRGGVHFGSGDSRGPGAARFSRRIERRGGRVRAGGFFRG